MPRDGASWRAAARAALLLAPLALLALADAARAQAVGPIKHNADFGIRSYEFYSIWQDKPTFTRVWLRMRCGDSGIVLRGMVSAPGRGAERADRAERAAARRRGLPRDSLGCQAAAARMPPGRARIAVADRGAWRPAGGRPRAPLRERRPSRRPRAPRPSQAGANLVAPGPRGCSSVLTAHASAAPPKLTTAHVPTSKQWLCRLGEPLSSITPQSYYHASPPSPAQVESNLVAPVDLMHGGPH